MESNNNFDEIRAAILKYLDEVMAKARNENMARETDAQIQIALREFNYQDNEVTRELIYLVEKGFIKKTIVRGSSMGVSKTKFVTTYYYISSKGRDHLHGASQEFKSSNYFGGINITSIQGQSQSAKTMWQLYINLIWIYIKV